MMTKQRIFRIQRRIQDSRCRLMKERPYFALMLMYLKFVAVPGMKKISTNGRCVYFNPDFLEKLYDYELDYILCHQIMHIVVGQIWREDVYKGDDYHFACNIIINSMLEEQNLLPDHSSHLGELATCIPGTHYSAKDCTPEQVLANSFYRISYFDERTRNRYLQDSDSWWDNKDDNGAEGIMILDIPKDDPIIREGAAESEAGEGNETSDAEGDGKSEDTGENSPEEWQRRSKTASHFIFNPKNDGEDSKHFGNMPGFLRRMYEKKDKPQIDWRKLLNDFIQEQVSDYSFAPPDRRFSDTGFFLPDFNEKEFVTKDILFMVDTSGSVRDEDISRVYTEICSACEQFQGSLYGKLGFFDAAVTDPIPFESAEDILSIIPYGGGGTDFTVIFDYIRDVYRDVYPSCIIIFTDGQGPYPEEADTLGIPTLWILDNQEVIPPFGRIVRLQNAHS